MRQHRQSFTEMVAVRILRNFCLTGAGGPVSIYFRNLPELTSMIDPKLEEEVASLKRCMENLKRFHDIFDSAVLTETVLPQDEEKIRELRRVLPEQWDGLHAELGVRHDESVSAIVEMASSLPEVVSMTDFQKRKLYDLWHKSFMKLHFLLGKLQHRKEKLEALRPGRLKAKRFLTSPIVVIIAGLVVLLLYLILR